MTPGRLDSVAEFWRAKLSPLLALDATYSIGAGVKVGDGKGPNRPF
jgi:hypothetical protein